jgi:hypothetical protein
MALLDRTSHDAPSGGTSRASRGEELTYLFFVLWTMIGLCLDGWAHRYQPELESFFTPWHAVFYTGFIFGTLALARMVIRRRPTSPSLRESIPDGYGLAVLGLGLFGLAGVGDGFWHTIFGVETGIDALLSPTHLMLLVGMLAGATAPVRAAWRNPQLPVFGTSLSSLVPTMLAVAVATTGVAFFFLYANGFSNWQMQRSYVLNSSESLISSGIFSTLASTVILLGPVMLILRRWKPPFWFFTSVFGIVGAFMAGLDAYRYWWQIIPAVVGGLTVDAVIQWRALDHGQGQGQDEDQGQDETVAARLRRRAWAAGAITPLTMWSVSTIAINAWWDVAWPPELWVGQIIMASLLGLGLGVITHPPALPSSLSVEA